MLPTLYQYDLKDLMNMSTCLGFYYGMVMWYLQPRLFEQKNTHYELSICINLPIINPIKSFFLATYSGQKRLKSPQPGPDSFRAISRKIVKTSLSSCLMQISSSAVKNLTQLTIRHQN